MLELYAFDLWHNFKIWLVMSGHKFINYRHIQQTKFSQLWHFAKLCTFLLHIHKHYSIIVVIVYKLVISAFWLWKMDYISIGLCHESESRDGLCTIRYLDNAHWHLVRKMIYCIADNSFVDVLLPVLWLKLRRRQSREWLLNPSAADTLGWMMRHLWNANLSFPFKGTSSIVPN